MEGYKFCFTCKEFHYSNKLCRSEYIVTDDVNVDLAGATFFASSYYEAALKYAEHFNIYGDLSLINTTRHIRVRHNNEVKQFKISARQSINYIVDELSKEGGTGFVKYVKLINESSLRYIGSQNSN